MSDTGASL